MAEKFKIALMEADRLIGAGGGLVLKRTAGSPVAKFPSYIAPKLASIGDSFSVFYVDFWCSALPSG